MTVAGHTVHRRAAALLLLALLVAALWLGPVRAYLGLVGAGAEQIAQQARLLQRYRALAQAPASDAAAARPDASPEMLPRVPEAQAVALLQEAVKKVAAASRVEIRSFQVLRGETLPGAVRIAVRVDATGDIASLARLLFAIEAARPVLYADNLQVRARPAAPGQPPAALDFQLDVSGFEPGAAS